MVLRKNVQEAKLPSLTQSDRRSICSMAHAQLERQDLPCVSLDHHELESIDMSIIV